MKYIHTHAYIHTHIIYAYVYVCVYIYSHLSHLLKPRLDTNTLYHQNCGCFSETPTSLLHTFLFLQPIPKQLPSSHHPIWPFLVYCCLPSLGSNYFSIQIWTVLFLSLVFLQPIYTFYWCKINLHSIVWLLPHPTLAHKIPVVFIPTTFSSVPWLFFEIVHNLDLASHSRFISHDPRELSLPSAHGFCSFQNTFFRLCYFST